MPQRRFNLVAVMIVATVAMTLALLGLDSGIVPIVLGLPLALFLPGYALTALIAPGTLNRPAAWLLSFGLSLGLTVIGRVLLNWTPWGLQISLWAVYLGSITLIAAMIALIRHHARSEQALVQQPEAWQQLLAFGAAGAIVTALAVAGTGATQQARAAFKQFWVADATQPAPAPTMRPETLVSASPAPTATISTPPTPSPTATIAASPTPSPTRVVETSTPTATPLPTVTATAPASSPTPQVRPMLAADRLDIALSDWPTRTTETASLSYTDDQYRLMINGQPSASVSSTLPADDYRLSIDVAIKDGEAGVIFLAIEPITFYRIIFNTQGAYTIQRVHQNTNEVSTIVDWMASTALQSSDTIHVQIERQGATIQFFANDELLTTMAVPDSPVTNQVGVVLTDPSERGQATFTNLVVEQLFRQ